MLDATVAPVPFVVGLVVFAAAVALIGFWWLPRRKARKQLLNLFALDADRWRPIASDMHGWALKHMHLTGDGLGGVPDAVFKHRCDKTILVGDYKNRVMQEEPSLYERYQLILYMGLLQKRYPRHTIQGCVRYRNQVVTIPYEQFVYDALIHLVDEYRRCRRQKKIIDHRPLHQRSDEPSTAVAA